MTTVCSCRRGSPDSTVTSPTRFNGCGDDSVSLHTFVDWFVAAGPPIERIDDYDEWLTRFAAAMNALPETMRKNSMLPLMAAYAKPGQPTHGTQIPAEKFRAAVQSAASAAPAMSRM